MVAQIAVIEETEPLLADESTVFAPARSQRKKFTILIICAIFVLAADIGTFISLAPETAILEQIICRNQGVLPVEADPARIGTLQGIGSDPCKSEAVQAELALVQGYKDTFEVLPSILLSLPYGVLSDHWGRKPVLYLGIVGILLGELWIRLVGEWLNRPFPKVQAMEGRRGGLLSTCGEIQTFKMLTHLSSNLFQCSSAAIDLDEWTIQNYRWRRPDARDHRAGHGGGHFFRRRKA